MLIPIRIAFGILSMTVLSLATAGAQELTEQEAVGLFLTQSPQPKELQAEVAAVRAQTRGWGLWPNPAAVYSREGAGLTHFAQMEQALPVSGRLGLMRQAAGAAFNAAESKSRFALWDRASEMRQGFYGLLLAQEREATIRNSLHEIEEVLGILREREKEGEGSTFDRLRGERERAELLAELASAQVDTAEARSRLASFFALNTKPSSLRVQGEFQSAALLPPLSELIQRALQGRGDYRAELQQLGQLQFERQAAGRLWIPEPVLLGGLKRAAEFRGVLNGPFIAFSLPLPIFNRGQFEVARLRAESGRVQARQQTLEQRLRTEVEAAYNAAELRRRIAEQYLREQSSQVSQLVLIAQTGYLEGELGILELLDAYRVSRQSKLRVTELAAAAKQAEIDLERVVGESVVSKGVWP